MTDRIALKPVPTALSGKQPAAPSFPAIPLTVGTNIVSVGQLLAQARASKLNALATSAEPEQATVAGENALVRLVYGRRRLGAQITAIATPSNALILRCVWCHGPIDAIEEVQINDEAVPAGVTITHYLGTTGQGIDATLQAAFALQGKTYADTLPGIAYSVVVVPQNTVSGFPAVTAKLRGMKVRRIAQEAIAFNATSSVGTVADSAQNDVSEDFEIVVGAAATDWTPLQDRNILSKWRAATGQRCFRFILKTNGTLSLEVSADGTTASIFTSLSTIGAVNGSTLWLRVRFQLNDGTNSRAKFATSPDGAVWTALGADITSTTLAGLFNSTEPLRLGGIGDATGYFDGSIYAAKMVTASKVVCDLVAFEAPENVTTWQDAANATWTLSNATTPNTRAWSQDPIDCLCDFATSDVYGADLRVDVGSALYAYAITSQQVGIPAEAYAQLDLTIDESRPAGDWIDVLRDYAYCFAIPEGDKLYLVRDWNDAAVYTFDTSNVIERSLTYEKRSAGDTSTAVQVTYTDTSGARWRDYALPVSYANGVQAGTVPRRLQQVAKPGLTRYSEANRYQIQRLNKSQLGDLVISFRAFDDAIQVRPGYICAVTHPIGFTAKPFRILRAIATEPGRWTITAQEHDPLMYSTSVAAAPSVGDSTLPSPANPPTVTGLAAVEDVYQVQTGLYASRLRITWNDATTSYPFVGAYVVTISQAGQLVQGPVVVPQDSQTFVSGPLKENLLHIVSVQVQSSVGILGASASASITNNGKQAKPSDVPSITGFEVGGEVRLSWVPATDLDLTAHEIRYSATGGSWSTATLLDRVATPSVRYNTKVVPAGLWRFWIKGLDSVRSATYPYGQESVNAAFVDITVTSDANAFVAASYSFATPTLFKFSVAQGGWISDYGATWNATFTSALNTYTNALQTYSGTGTSLLLTEIFDAGATLTGDWFGALTYQDLAGTASTFLDLTAGPEGNKTITGATNATPIVITSTAHGYANGDEVVISGVVGNTAANGRFKVASVAANTFALQQLDGATSVAGNGAYTSGGVANRWPWQSFTGGTGKGAYRYARLRITTTGTAFVTSLGSASVNVIARRESSVSPITTLASGPLVVELANHYAKAKSITANAVGTASAILTYDSVEVSAGRGIGSGRARRFASTSDYSISVSVPSAAAFQFTATSAFTLEVLVKAPASDASFPTLVDKLLRSANSKGWRLLIAPDGTVQFLVTENQTVTNRSVSSLPIIDGLWHRVSGVFNGSTNTQKLYIDGALVAQQSVTALSSAPDDPTQPLHFGGTALNGVLDDVRIWNVERTAAQIAANANVALVGNESGLAGYWRLDETSGATATDSTSNANNGTYNGASYPRPYDGFDLYAFNASGTQIAQSATWTFDGV